MRGPEKINQGQKCQSQRFGPSEIPLGRGDPPALLQSPPARPLQPRPSLRHNTETVSGRGSLCCHSTARADPHHPAHGREQWLKRGTRHIPLSRERGSGGGLTTEVPGPPHTPHTSPASAAVCSPRTACSGLHGQGFLDTTL